jgi:hypothetical protein
MMMMCVSGETLTLSLVTCANETNTHHHSLEHHNLQFVVLDQSFFYRQNDNRQVDFLHLLRSGEPSGDPPL